MDNEQNWMREDEEACRRLSPVVHRACVGEPGPQVLAAIRSAAAQRGADRARNMLFFRVAYAAAALLAVVLSAWQAFRPAPQAETELRVASVVDDAMFLCTEGGEPAGQPGLDREDLAWKLLNLQGLDTVTTPTAEAAEPASPLSIDSQSRNTPELLAQRCG